MSFCGGDHPIRIELLDPGNQAAKMQKGNSVLPDIKLMMSGQSVEKVTIKGGIFA